MIKDRRDLNKSERRTMHRIPDRLVERLSYRRAFFFMFLVSVAIRLVALALAAPQPLVSDSTDYREMAVLLANGTRFLPYWPPGLPLYLAPFIAAGFGDGVLRAAMLFWWLLFCWGIYRLAGDVGAKKIAWLVLLVFAVAPAEIHFSLEPMTQMPAAALLLLAMSAAVRCAKDLSRPRQWKRRLWLPSSSACATRVTRRRSSARPSSMLTVK